MVGFLDKLKQEFEERRGLSSTQAPINKKTDAAALSDTKFADFVKSWELVSKAFEVLHTQYNLITSGEDKNKFYDKILELQESKAKLNETLSTKYEMSAAAEITGKLAENAQVFSKEFQSFKEFVVNNLKFTPLVATNLKVIDRFLENLANFGVLQKDGAEVTK